MLDTDVASYVIKRQPPLLVDRLAAFPPADLCISAVTCAELLYGLRRLDAAHRLQLGVRQFLRIIRILPWTADAAEYYADIRQRLVSAGQPIGELDMMIAAHSLAAGAVLVTNNLRHYQRIAPPLALADWST